MNVSLEQAIEIHARALVGRVSDRAPLTARQYADAKRNCGDFEGYEVWLRVALAAEQLLVSAAAWAATSQPFPDNQ
jgi:hypothetical protein